ncbi:MAG: two-component system sensor histidine kinase NtrB [Candidatus Kariarchaeaceae archaeon]|jgi:signal transduction histidine kinase
MAKELGLSVYKRILQFLLQTRSHPILTSLYVLYFSLLFPLFEIMGTVYLIFATIPILASSMKCGYHKGLMLTSLTILINIGIVVLATSYSFSIVFSLPFIIGSVHFVILSTIVGLNVDKRRKLEQERKIISERHERSKKLEIIGELIGGVAHDFNNLLAIIKGNSELLQLAIEEENDLKSVEHIDSEVVINEIIVASDRASELIRKLIDFSSTNDVKFEAINVNELITEFISFLNHFIVKSVKFSSTLRGTNSHIFGNQSQLINALLNLAVNAMDAMPNGGSLCLETDILSFDELKHVYNPEYISLKKHADKYVQLKVTDTGNGMNEDVLANLFHPFYTTKTETKKGVGLGLFGVYSIVKSHKGVISVQSKVNNGTEFVLSLPIVE